MARGTESINGVSAGEDDLRCEALVHKHMNSAVDAMVLRCALKLQIFDAIHRHAGRAVSVPDLAAAMPAASVHHSTLRRVLRYLANMHLLAVDGGEAEEVYTLTPASSIYLRTDSEKSLAAFVMLLTEAEMLAPFSALEACVAGKNGPDVPAIELVGGKSFYAMAAMDPAKGKVFDGAMKVMVRRTSEAVVKGCPAVFEGVATVVDVGGGEGIMAAAIARAFPTTKCVVLEQAHVVERAPEIERVEFVAGDMFVSLPRADALLFTRVLHNWSDEKAAEILKQCRKATDGDKGKVIIIDVVIDDSGDDEDVHQVKLIRDIIMMAHYGGKQRTKEEWRSLLSKVGFKNCSFTRLEAFEHVIEARP
ncbi:(RS)-norcoclaurine 6-O-methyltransferase [Apostasia shenzhenica]|uniref:(RS)-norcoclaurine 6-O-methyltransferase n=1 Tax=Apostasia shenzhenica TaxID=1088818 RepID=A0A2H9ZXN1_9ASPA|nr:(RS)-norcoclaurine 6-O-methyltransferase [Apostasia shenzhenica]